MLKGIRLNTEAPKNLSKQIKEDRYITHSKVLVEWEDKRRTWEEIVAYAPEGEFLYINKNSSGWVYKVSVVEYDDKGKVLIECQSGERQWVNEAKVVGNCLVFKRITNEVSQRDYDTTLYAVTLPPDFDGTVNIMDKSNIW